MSNPNQGGPFERVIENQQKEIDRLGLAVRNNTLAWHRENEAVEQVAEAAFGVLNHPDSQEYRLQLRRSLLAMGFCSYCECRPCDCDFED